MHEITGAAEDLEGRDRVVSFLHHVIKLRDAVFQARRRVVVDGLAQPFVEFAGLDTLAPLRVNVEGQIKQFGDVLAADGAGENQRRPRNEVEVMDDPRSDLVAREGVLFFGSISFAYDKDQSPARLFDHAGDFLVQLDVQLVDVHKKQAYIRFFNSS